MNSRTDFIKIRTSLHFGLYPMEITNNGVKFNDNFIDRFIDVEEEFRSKIMLPINEAVGLHNWAIMFTEHPTENPKFFADIYCDNKEHYPVIAGIIRATIEDIEFSYWYKGDVATYIGS